MITSTDFHNVIIDRKNTNRKFADEFVVKLDVDNPGMFSAAELRALSLIAEILAGNEELKESVQTVGTEEGTYKAIEDGVDSAIKGAVASYERLYTDSALYEFECDCFASEFLTA